ncbi:hypothetical protein V2J09_000669 [Rumex salicifolius]
MESECLPQHSRVTVAQWTDLPPELVEIISNGFQNPNDITRFRSLCRSWRLLTSPPHSPNIISPLFPLTISFFREEFSPITILASAVYLLRPRSDPSKALMVHAQETGVRKLVLRHALTYEKIVGTPGNSLDLLEWSVTEIANSMATTKSANSAIKSKRRRRCKVVLGVGDTKARQLSDDNNFEIEDTVIFNGRNIYVINSAGRVYIVSNESLQLLRVKSRYIGDPLSKSCQKRFVVSDGDLYVALRFRREFENPPECQIYKIVMENKTCWNWERVEYLGDKVFFFIRDCSFSVSARDLPHPWKGNCVVVDNNVHREAFPFCGCYSFDKEIEVFHLGDQQPRFSLLSSLIGYSELFTPPSSWINQRDLKAQESTSKSQSISARASTSLLKDRHVIAI